MNQLDDAVRVLDLLGVAANVLLAGVLAREKRFDLVGFLVLGVAAGLGGGMIRDTLLQRGTPVALTDLSYQSVAFATAVIAYLVHMEGRWWSRGIRIIDAIALGTWGAVGAQKALSLGLHWLPSIMLGTITAVGGGMVRDIMLRRTPIVAMTASVREEDRQICFAAGMDDFLAKPLNITQLYERVDSILHAAPTDRA